MTGRDINAGALIVTAETLFLISIAFVPGLQKLYAVAGAMWVCAATAPEPLARKCLRLFAVLCIVTSALGFWSGTAPLFGTLPNQYGDRWFYLAVAAIALYAARPT